MATLETTFAGLKLRNPIIISSSGLTDSAAKNQKLYEAGAGANCTQVTFRGANHDGSRLAWRSQYVSGRKRLPGGIYTRTQIG